LSDKGARAGGREWSEWVCVCARERKSQVEGEKSTRERAYACVVGRDNERAREGEIEKARERVSCKALTLQVGNSPTVYRHFDVQVHTCTCLSEILLPQFCRVDCAWKAVVFTKPEAVVDVVDVWFVVCVHHGVGRRYIQATTKPLLSWESGTSLFLIVVVVDCCTSDFLNLDVLTRRTE
jgi:hypothetical protein